MSKIKLLKIDTLDDGTERFQSQLLVGTDTANFVRGTDGVMKFWRYGVMGGVGFYEYTEPYEIVERKEDMRVQEL